MGFFKTFFNEVIKAANEATFTPDFNKTEYDNWLNFIDRGGTSEEWNKLVSVNNWHFKENEAEKYKKEVKYAADNYYYLLSLIQREWSVLYNLNCYNGKQAKEFEKMCLNSIAYYMEMRQINLKYNETTPLNVPAFTRLAMLYEKQGEYEKAAFICKEACLLGIDERSRFIRMMKKANRTPTSEELTLIK